MKTESLLQLIVETADAFKALALTPLKVTGMCTYADYFIIMTGTSTTHVASISEEIIRKCKKNGHKPQSIEGLSKAEWVLLDIGDCVVHIFLASVRQHYQLEALWPDAENVLEEAKQERA